MKNRIITAIVGTMAAAIVLSGCNSVQASVRANENVTTEGTETVVEESSAEGNSEDVSASDNSEMALSDDKSTELLDGDKLSDEELSSFQDYFNQSDNYGFIRSSYETPDKIDWSWVFAYGAGIDNCEYSQEALDAYLKANEYESVEYDLIALSGKDVRSFVEAKTGITDFDVSLVDGYTYVEADDVLFRQVSDTFDRDVICYEGVRSGDLIQITVQAGVFDNKRLITLVDTKDSTNQYHFSSNRELWEEDADNIIEATNFDTGDKVTCAVKKTDNGPDIQIIENNATVQTVYPRRSAGDSSECDDISEIAFGDVDNDGFNDMIVIMSYGDAKKAVLLNGSEDKWGHFEYGIYGKESVTEWLGANVDEMTAENVINYIKDHQDEYKNL